MGNTVRIRNGMSNATEGDILGNASDLIKDLGVVDLAGGHLLVTEDSPKGMTVQVAGGIVYVPNSNYDELDSDTPKFYPVVCSSEVLAVDNNVSGSTRFDIVCVKVDKTIVPDADADNIATKIVVKGTPGAGVPTTPANHYKLAEIEVANGETEITNALITDTREQVLLDGTFVESLGLVWKGAWATSTPYSLNDTVEHNGSGYVCIQANTSEATTEPGVGASWTDYWDLFVEGSDPARAETLTNKTLTNPTVNFTDKAVTQNVLVWAYRNGDQDNLADSTATTVQLNGEIYDVGGDFNTSTYTFTAPVAGYYLILAQVTYNDNVDAKRYDCLIRKNGSAFVDSYSHSSGTGALSVSARTIANLAVNDTIILQARQYAGVNTVDITGTGGATFLQIMLLSL